MLGRKYRLFPEIDLPPVPGLIKVLFAMPRTVLTRAVNLEVVNKLFACHIWSLFQNDGIKAVILRSENDFLFLFKKPRFHTRLFHIIPLYRSVTPFCRYPPPPPPYPFLLNFALELRRTSSWTYVLIMGRCVSGGIGHPPPAPSARI